MTSSIYIPQFRPFGRSGKLHGAFGAAPPCDPLVPGEDTGGARSPAQEAPVGQGRQGGILSGFGEQGSSKPWCMVYGRIYGIPRGSRYLIIKELGLKDHDYYGLWGLRS